MAEASQQAIEHFKILRYTDRRSWDIPKTKAMYNFLLKEAPHRVVGLSIETDGVFIYTDSEKWSDDAGAGTFREDSETLAIKKFYERVQPSILENPKRRKNPVKRYFQLYDVANDYSLSPVPGKYQFGDLAHAKKQAQDLIDKWVAGMKTRAGKLSAYKIKWHRGAAAGIRPESKMEWNGFIHDGEAVYKIIERSKNPVKKKTRTKRKTRKGNPERITQAWLDKRVSLLNDMLGLPEAQYTKKADGGLTGNRGHLFIDHAYGGVKVAEMSGGGTGENNISDGYVSKKELNNFINGMIAAARLAERHKNPHKRKVRRKKNTAYTADKKYIAFKCVGAKVYFLHLNIARPSGYEFKQGKRGALLFNTQEAASDLLEIWLDTGRAHSATKFGVVISTTTAKVIAAFCRKQRGKV